jgi:hypothetical protein
MLETDDIVAVITNKAPDGILKIIYEDNEV